MAAYTLIITNTGVQLLGSSGTLTTLPLPTGVSATGLPAYVARLNNRFILTNCVSSPVWLGADLLLRILAMPTPSSAPALTTGTGTYTGTRRCRISYLLRDGAGNVLAEGPLGPPSAAAVFANQGIVIGSLPIPASNAPVTDLRIYFTTDGGATYFHAFDVAGLTLTSVTTSISDASLSLVSASTELVAAPVDIDLLVTWKNRIFARSQVDLVVGTAAGLTDRWPNVFPVDQGVDGIGLTGFLARRDELAIGRRDRIWKLTGDTEDTFALVKLIDGKGIVSPTSCIVVRDIGYFLSDDGFYSWSVNGVTSLTDDSVRSWFTSDTYFNRAQFPFSFTGYDPVAHRIRLHLANVGSIVNDRWVELDILSGKWFGPHKCDAVTNFTSATVSPDVNGVLRLILSANDGFLYAPTPGSSTDGVSTAINMDITSKFHAGYSAPTALGQVVGLQQTDDTHLWLQPSVFTHQESGGTLSITPTVGDLTSAAGATLSHDLTIERERLPRIGDVGRLCQLRFQESTAGQPVQIYGYEIPYIRVGRR